MEFSTEAFLDNGMEVFWDSFNESLYFIIGLFIVLCGAGLVGYILIKTIDREQEPFLAFYWESVDTLPLLATIFVVFTGLVQTATSLLQFFNGEGDHSLGEIAMRNTVAAVGMELAFLVVFGAITILSLFFRGVSEEVEEVTQERSRSGKRD